MFLSRITTELKIPVLGLVDSDPYGLKILSVYMSGSKNMSYDSASLTTPDIMWLGLRPSDLNKYDLPDQCRLDMTENDIKTGQELMKEDFIMKNPKWMKELEIMVSIPTACVGWEAPRPISPVRCFSHPIILTLLVVFRSRRRKRPRSRRYLRLAFSTLQKSTCPENSEKAIGFREQSSITLLPVV